VTNAGTMFTSIPYDAGWKISVDGAPVKTLAIAEGLLGVDLTEGTHRIEMHYLPPRLIEGAAITGFSLILLGAIFLLLSLIRRRRPPDAPLFDAAALQPEWSDDEDEMDTERPGFDEIETVIGTSVSSGVPKHISRHHSATPDPIRRFTPPLSPPTSSDVENEDFAASGGQSGRADLEHGIREDLAEQQGNEKQEDGESKQDEQGIDRSL
jgi:hypothetical protein